MKIIDSYSYIFFSLHLGVKPDSEGRRLIRELDTCNIEFALVSSGVSLIKEEKRSLEGEDLNPQTWATAGNHLISLTNSASKEIPRIFLKIKAFSMADTGCGGLPVVYGKSILGKTEKTNPTLFKCSKDEFLVKMRFGWNIVTSSFVTGTW